MMTRRQLLVTAATTAVAAPVVAWLTAPVPASASVTTFPVVRSDDEWRARLTPAAYRVLRQQGTERAFSSPLEHEHRDGGFVCAGCARPLFAAAAKFESGTGWPSFWQALDDAVRTRVDASWLMIRTEVHCAGCGGHLGHLFTDGPRPTGLRYCMNGVALRFVPA